MIANKEYLCKDWQIIKPSKKDTRPTQEDVVASNERREPWCK